MRGGNPKGIEDWDDLTRDDVEIVFPNPKTSGNARYTYLAAYAYALEKFGGDDAAAQEFVGKILSNVVVFDTGGRGATTSFVERELGDVLITFEAEVENIRASEDEGAFDRVVPAISLLAEFPVALVDKVADARGSRAVGEAYLDFLYSKEAQEIIAGFNNRVHHPEVVAATADKFPAVRLITVEEVFGSWAGHRKPTLAMVEPSSCFQQLSQKSGICVRPRGGRADLTPELSCGFSNPNRPARPAGVFPVSGRHCAVRHADHLAALEWFDVAARAVEPR